jgi:hypothetical protein
MANDPTNTDPAAGAPATDRAALAAAVAELRRGLAAGRAVDPAALRGLVEAVAAPLPRARHPGGIDMALVALIDEVDLLVAALVVEHATLAEQLRTATRHRRAGTAYGGRSVG